MPLQSSNPPEIIDITGFQGQNSQASRSSIGDQELFWCENLTPVGAGNLRSVNGPGAAIYTAPSGETVEAMFGYVRGGTQYLMVFLSNGAADELNLSTNAIATAFAAATFTAFPPRLASWGTSGIVIVANQTNGYWAWDGTAYAAGAASPTWLNGGTATTMPTGIQGTAVNVFQSRVVIANGAQWMLSAPNNGAQFGTSDGGVLSTSVDPFLVARFTDIAQTSGFLYLFGDSSINVVSNIATAGSPATTTFSNANVDPQVGHASPYPVVSFGRALIFWNGSGLYALYGGAAQKISSKLDQLIATVPSTWNVSLAVTTLNGVKIVLALLTVTDIFGTNRAIMAAWDGQVFHVLSQGLSLTQIAPVELNSIIDIYGTNGTSIYELFAGAGTGLTKILQSKLYPGKNVLTIKQSLRLYGNIQDIAGTGVSLTATVDNGSTTQSAPLNVASNAVWLNSTGASVTWENASSTTVSWIVAGALLIGTAAHISGTMLGTTIKTTSESLAFIRLAISYEDRVLLGA